MLGSLWLDSGDCAVGVAVSWAGPEKGAGAIRGLETDPEGPRVAENHSHGFSCEKIAYGSDICIQRKILEHRDRVSLSMYKNTMHIVYPIYCTQ